MKRNPYHFRTRLHRQALRLAFALLSLVCHARLAAQPGTVGSFYWGPNPTILLGGPASNGHYLVGNDWNAGQNTLMLAHYLQDDTTFTIGWGHPTMSLVATDVASTGQGKLVMVGGGSDDTLYFGFVAVFDSTTLAVLSADYLLMGDQLMATGVIPVGGGGSLVFYEASDWPNDDLLLQRLDANGAPLWNRSYRFGEGVRISEAFVHGSDLLVTGYYDLENSDRSAPFVGRFDGSGNLVSARVYHSLRDESLNAAARDDDGNLYLATASTDTVTGNASVKVFSLDSTGSFRWGSDLAFDTYNEPFSVLLWPGVGVYVAGTLSDGDFGPMFLSKFSYSGQHLWSKSYLDGGYAEPQSMVLTANDELLIAVVDENIPDAVRVLHTDSLGQMPSDCSDSLLAPVVTPFILSPTTITATAMGTPTTQAFTLTPYQPALAFNQSCTGITARAEPEVAEALLYPQPMHGRAVLRCGDAAGAVLEVFDLRGQRVEMLATPHPEGLELHRNGCAAGLYAYRVTKEGALVASGKLLLGE